MVPAILGIKQKQTQIFTDKGMRIPVTVIEAGPCIIGRIIDQSTHKSYQIFFGTAKKLNKPMRGQVQKLGIEEQPRYVREIRVTSLDGQIQAGQKVSVSDVLSVGDRVSVVGKSKGKGFAGVVKRHGFHGGPRTHGQSDRERSPGSIGQTTTPGRVYKGKRMAGRMGGERVTTKGLKVVRIDPEENLLYLKGLVPGSKGSLVTVQVEKKKD